MGGHSGPMSDVERSAPVRYGATLRLRHQASGACLRSYPFGGGRLAASGQATVTCGAGAEGDDRWRVQGPHGVAPDLTRQVVQHGDLIRLEQAATRKNLHSHAGYPSPVSGHQEVTCFGELGLGDAGDDWRVEVEGGGAWDAAHAVRLIHVASGNLLRSQPDAQHPQWTMGQQEVACAPDRDGNESWLAADLLANDARFITQSLPASVGTGETQSINVTFRNVGFAPWSAVAGHRLGSQAPADNQTWGTTRAAFEGEIAPGQDVTISFPITAPTTRGPTLIRWQMRQEGEDWFGDLTPPVKINVVLPGGPVTVPDVRGAFKSAAMTAVRVVGLEPRVTGETTSRSIVGRQSPAPHTIVDRGTTVVLHLEVP
jgi:hypothetical protein